MYSYEKVLPIGSVVFLKGAKQRVMILGYQRMSADSSDKTIYDCCGCPYPQGFISPEKTAIFNHDMIELYPSAFRMKPMTNWLIRYAKWWPREQKRNKRYK